MNRCTRNLQLYVKNSSKFGKSLIILYCGLLGYILWYSLVIIFVALTAVLSMSKCHTSVTQREKTWICWTDYFTGICIFHLEDTRYILTEQCYKWEGHNLHQNLKFHKNNLNLKCSLMLLISFALPGINYYVI